MNHHKTYMHVTCANILKTHLIFKHNACMKTHDEKRMHKQKKAMQAKYNCMHGGARVGGCDCDEQAHKGEVAHDIAVLAQKRAVADAVAPGSRSTARRPFRAVLGSLGCSNVVRKCSQWPESRQ